MDTVNGSIRTTGATLTRPADTNAYTAGDVIADATSGATVFTIPNVGGTTKGGTIIQDIICIDSASVATKPDLELWLFDTAPAAQQDNAAYAPTDAELLRLVGVVSFATGSFKVGLATAGAGGNSICESGQLGIPINTTQVSGGALYCMLVVRNAYVPVSAETFTFRVRVLD